MFKQKSVNENKKWSSLKKIYQNKRYKALIQLGLYLIFFIFILVLVGSNEEIKDIKNDNKNETIKSNYTYSYTYEIIRDGIDEIINYTGSVNKDETIGQKSINNKVDEFYLKDNITYILGVMDKKWHAQEEGYNIYKEIDTTFINYDNILRIIEKGELISTETLHKDKITTKTYEISLTEVISIYENINNIKSEETDEKLEGNIVIKLSEGEESFIKVELDVTPVIKYYDSLIEKYYITLNYSSIGIVSNFDIDLGLD